MNGIGRRPGERTCLALVRAVLDHAAAGWRGATYTPADVRRLQTICRDLGTTRRRRKQEHQNEAVATAA